MIQSVEKALRILLALDANGSWLGVRELARSIKLTPPTTHSLLKTLCSLGFAEHNPDTKQYRIGLTAIRLGQRADPLKNLGAFARPYIEALSNEFGETVLVQTWLNGQCTVVDWIQSRNPLAVTHSLSASEHPIVSASGRVLLAYQERSAQMRYAAQEDLSRFGPNSPLTAEDMFQLLDRIAAEGHAVTANVANCGIAAAAAPVFDATNRVVLAVGCSAPISRMNETHLAIVLGRVREIATMMTKTLGGTGPAKPQSAAA
jgi:DNA-binding IclR family transcriptional regulator